MTEFFTSSVYFGLLMSLAFYYLPRYVNKKLGTNFFHPLLTAIILCCAVLLLFDISYDDYYRGAQVIDRLLTPATICLAIPLYRQYTLLRQNVKAVLLSCLAGVLANMAFCVLLLTVCRLNAAEFASLLPKSVTAAIGNSLSAELGGFPETTMFCITITGLLGAVIAPGLLKIFRVTDPLAQGLAIGTASHASGTARAVELGDLQGAASSLAIVVTGLLTVIVAPFMFLFVQ